MPTQPARSIATACPVCEGRGILGDGGDELACPQCRPWCTLCLRGVPSRPPLDCVHRGVLVAGVLSRDESLFRGYVCDVHKGALDSLSFIAPWMVDAARFQIGSPFIATQFGWAFVSLYALGEAANWNDLERAAFLAVEQQGVTIVNEWQLRFYRCPHEIGQRALRPTLPRLPHWRQ